MYFRRIRDQTRNNSEKNSFLAIHFKNALEKRLNISLFAIYRRMIANRVASRQITASA